MATHPAVKIVARRAPLEILPNPTVTPGRGQIRVRNDWATSNPLDLHLADGGLLIQEYPAGLGSGMSGTVVEVGEGVDRFAVGEKVFGFQWRSGQEKGHQLYITSDDFLFGKLPANITQEAAVTIPSSCVTVFHTIQTELGIELPWPKPENYSHAAADLPFLIWGGSSTVGHFALEVLKYYGFRHIITTASKRHHDALKASGAQFTIDYNDGDVIERVNAASENKGIPYIIDCIGSLDGSVKLISKLADAQSKIGIMLPIIVRDATDEVAPVYSMEVTDSNVNGSIGWAEGAQPIGVRTHFYLRNEGLKEKLQVEIIPQLVAEGHITPTPLRIVEGPTMLSRAQAALDALRRKEVSYERLVWRISED